MRTETIGAATLFCADCRDVRHALINVAAVITDPPYGILVPGDFSTRVRDDRGGKHGLVRTEYTTYVDSYENFTAQIVPRLNAYIDLAERAAVFSGPHIHEQKKPDAIGGVYCPAATGRNVWGFKSFLPVLLYGIAPDLHLGARYRTAISSTAVAEDNGHPCPKPLPWMAWLAELVSRIDELVVDPFMGSGTTGVACVTLGRRFIGIELNEAYFDIACRRIELAQRQPDLFIARQASPKQPVLPTEAA